MSSETREVALPPFPQHVKLRAAKPSDVSRMSIVVTAAFFYSPIFQWSRPHHKQHPEDTLLAYKTLIQKQMQAQESVVLVVEDSYQPNERSGQFGHNSGQKNNNAMPKKF